MRFTIRDLLWLTVVVALGVAWGMDRQRLDSERRKAVERADKYLRAALDFQKRVHAKANMLLQEIIAETRMPYQERVRRELPEAAMNLTSESSDQSPNSSPPAKNLPTD